MSWESHLCSRLVAKSFAAPEALKDKPLSVRIIVAAFQSPFAFTSSSRKRSAGLVGSCALSLPPVQLRRRKERRAPPLWRSSAANERARFLHVTGSKVTATDGVTCVNIPALGGGAVITPLRHSG